MKRLLSLSVCLMIALLSFAHDFELDGIYYNITSFSDLTVEVTFRGDYYNSYSNEYTGTVNIPQTVTYNGKTYSVTSIGKYVFYYCSGLTSVTIPNSVTTIGGGAFAVCSGLKSITIPNSVTSIEGYTFEYCSGLTSVTIPNSVTSIGEYAFYYCSRLTSITIPNSVTSIGEDACYACRGLTSITIPNSVTTIGGGAFADCSGLTEIISQIEKPFAVGLFCFSWVDRSIPVYVPVGTKSLYENTYGWSDFTNIIERGLAPKGKGESEDYGNGGKINSSTDLGSTVIDDVYYNIPNTAGGYDAASGSVVLQEATADGQVQAIAGKDVYDADVAANFNGIILLLPAGTGVLSIDAETLGNMTLKIKIGDGEPTAYQLNGKQTVNVPYNDTASTYAYIYAGQSAGAKSLNAPTADNALRIYSISLQDASTTGIEPTVTAETKSESHHAKGIYTLTGVKVSDDASDLKTLPRGIYIVNGKKVAIK